MTHQEQSNAEVASWDISRVFPWLEQTLPPLALAYKHRTVESGKDKIELKRLHLILAAAADLPGARSFMPLLKQKKRGRGMGSPIPSPEEGAWTREGPRVVGGGLCARCLLIPSTWNHEGTWLRHTP